MNLYKPTLDCLASLHQDARNCLDSLINLRERAAKFHDLQFLSREPFDARELRDNCLIPLFSKWAPVGGDPSAISAAFGSLRSARVALSRDLPLPKCREMNAPDAHELLFMVRDFFLLLWNRAVTPVANGQIPPVQGVSRFLKETWICLKDINDFNPTRLDAELHQEYAKAVEIVQTAAPASRRHRQMTLAAANSKATELAKADSTFLSKSQRAWAREIGCSDGLVTKLDLWKVKQKKADEEPQPKRSPKTVSLTHDLLAVVPDSDEELQRLIREQKSELEPSPLDRDPIDRPRRVRHRKKL